MTRSIDSTATEIGRSPVSRPTSKAVLVGLILAALFTVWGPRDIALATLAMWPLGLALGMLGVGLFRLRSKNDVRWHMLIVGQLLGVVAITLLFIASLG